MQEPDCLQNAFENHGLEGLTAEYAQKHIASGKQPVRYMTVWRVFIYIAVWRVFYYKYSAWIKFIEIIKFFQMIQRVG